jgi:diaminopimelate epimerase
MAGIEQFRTVALDSTSHPHFVTMLKHLASHASHALASTVTVLNDNGTVSVVTLKQAIKRDNTIMKALQEEKAYRPCLACGTHACPPGSANMCFESTDTFIGRAGDTQRALDAWIAESDYDPYNAYDAEGYAIL